MCVTPLARRDSFTFVMWLQIFYVRSPVWGDPNILRHISCVMCVILLTQEFWLKMFGSQDLSVFLKDLLRDAHSRSLPWKLYWNFGDYRENLFEMNGDSRENLFEFLAVVYFILAVVIILSPISSVCGDLWWVIRASVMTYSCQSRDWPPRVTWLSSRRISDIYKSCRRFEWVMSHIPMSHVTHNELAHI